ncbi:MAG: hypothetical protein QOH21_2628 [Acidobacteriota bacterium]|nr:hypothetical protein [Acidobacteriota bacterium]
MSQAELARRSGLSRTLIHGAERGGNLTLETLVKIAAHLPTLEILDLGPAKIRFGGQGIEMNEVVGKHLSACAAALSAASSALTEAAALLAESTRLTKMATGTPAAELEEWLPKPPNVPPEVAERIKRLDEAVDAGE